MRHRVLGSAELPTYPSYGDLVAAFLQPQEDKKDPKKKEPPKKKNAEGPIERLRSEFDKDCVRLEDGRIRIPGNTSLWAVSFAQNVLITSQSCDTLCRVLSLKEPGHEEIIVDGVVREPKPYSTTLQLQHFVVEHAKLDKKLQERINGLLRR
jgi:hypothetical protein